MPSKKKRGPHKHVHALPCFYFTPASFVCTYSSCHVSAFVFVPLIFCIIIITRRRLFTTGLDTVLYYNAYHAVIKEFTEYMGTAMGCCTGNIYFIISHHGDTT